jgi:hypothetical protein
MKKTDWKYLVDVLMFLFMIGIMLVGILLAFVLKEGPAVRESDKFFLGLHRHQWSHIHLYLSLAFAVTLVFHLLLEWSWIRGKSQRLFKTAWKPVLGLILAAAVLLPFGFWLLSEKNSPAYAELGFGRGGSRGQLANQILERRLPPQSIERTRTAIRPQDESQDAQEKQEAIARPQIREERFRREPTPSQTPEKKETSEHESKLVSGRLEGEQAALVITGRMTLRELEAATGIPAERILTKMGLPGNLSRNETLGRLRRRFGFTLPQLRQEVEGLMEKK